MRIAYVNTVYQQGSTGWLVSDIARYVETRGCQVDIATGRGHFAEENVYRIGSDFDLYAHAMASRLIDRAGFYSKRATKKYIERLRQINPDVIHLHNLHGYYIDVAQLFHYLKTEYKGKVVWTLHDCWPFTGHCAYYTSIGCQKWLDGCRTCPQKSVYPKSWVLDNSERNYRQKKEIFSGVPNLKIIAVSDWLKGQAEQSFLSQYPVSRIHNGIDLTDFRPVESDIRERMGVGCGRMVLSVAYRLNICKGIDRLVDVAKAAPDSWRFVAVGMEKKDVGRLPKNVTGIPRIDDKAELVKLYSAADALFNTSIEESFGLVTVEALACGTPAVVYDSTGSPELIRIASSGEIIPPSSTAKSAVEAIERAMAKQVDRSKVTYFSNRRMCEEYLREYQG